MMRRVGRERPWSRGLAIALIAVLAVLGAPAAPPARAVINGEAALASWGQVEVLLDGNYRCTGTLIAPNWVLTAAHCVPATGTISVRVGGRVRGLGAHMDVRRNVPHPNTDVTLLQLDTAVGWNAGIAYDDTRRPPIYQQVEIHGFGPTEPGGVPALELRTARLEVELNRAVPPMRDWGPDGALLQMQGVRGTPLQGDSGAGVIRNGRLQGVYVGLHGPQQFAVALQAIQGWIYQQTGVRPADTTERIDDLGVMPLGDVRIQGLGSSHGSGFRDELRRRTINEVHSFDFVGSQRSGQTPDPDHEGHPGATISEIARRADTAVPQYKPNVVLLNAGTTDMERGGIAGTAAELGSLIDQILEDAPKATVLVSTLAPARVEAVQERITSFNKQIPSVVAQRARAGKHVGLVDMREITTDDLTGDGLNLNDRGYTKMAEAFDSAIEMASAQNWIVGPRNEQRYAYRAMPLGSSTTYGEKSSDGNGYRDVLDQGLQDLAERNGGETGEGGTKAKLMNDTDDTPQVDMVGSVRAGRMADRDNEGWRGRKIHEIADKASCSVKLYKPNIITLIAGGNDVNQNYQMDGAIGRLESLIRQISKDADNTLVLVAGVQPYPDPAWDARGKSFNAKIPGLVEKLGDEGVNVMWVDTGLQLSDIGPDGNHPTDQGYDKIGAAFVKAANEANGQGRLVDPVYQKSEEVSDACGITDDGTGTDDKSSKLGPHWEDRGVIQAKQFPSSDKFWLVDINQDRKAEFVAVDKNQNFRFWWNGGPSGKAWVPFVEGQNSYKPRTGAVGNQLRFGDLDGDGFPDCMVVDLKGTVDLHTWKADNPSGSRMCMEPRDNTHVYSNGSAGERLNIDPNTKIRFADVTGGGRDDYLLIKPDGSTTAWYNRGFATERQLNFLDWTPPQQISGALQNPREIRYADINGDKRADRILITLKGGARAWINEGPRGSGGTYRDIGKIADDGDLPPKDIQFADLDGDGKADFVRIGWTGVTHAWLNKLPANYFDTFHP
ncbi:VCBS repeat-containing protein [Actinomadura graeca]|uniref:VCBS repeat-containing protein n=1 Tax=Actinomadura graeca TaxID=2750812 RepID=A0ABX8QYP2_9ACTN|nr:GDSL-type esterase/lipase family protein [Actinomadura graeca]QXJ23900.1 VCBS repeat-containing protein [Actinomadura graeca]